MENAVKEIERQLRFLKSSVEEKLQQHVLADHPDLTWFPRQGANCLLRYASEKTARWQSREGSDMVETNARVWRSNSLEVSSCPRATMWTSASNDQGTSSGTSFPDRKHSCDDEPRRRERRDLKGTLWQLKELRAAGASQPMLAGGEALLLIFPVKRKLYVLRSDVERLGVTDGHVARANLIQGHRASVTHSGTFATNARIVGKDEVGCVSNLFLKFVSRNSSRW